jgi:hypothetical protein
MGYRDGPDVIKGLDIAIEGGHKVRKLGSIASP